MLRSQHGLRPGVAAGIECWVECGAQLARQHRRIGNRAEVEQHRRRRIAGCRAARHLECDGRLADFPRANDADQAAFGEAPGDHRDVGLTSDHGLQQDRQVAAGRTRRGSARLWWIRSGFDPGDEAVAAAGNGQDEARLRFIVAKRAAQRRNLGAQVAVIDMPSRPDGAGQCIAVECLAGPLGKRDEQIERPLPDRNPTFAIEENLAAGYQREAAEPDRACYAHEASAIVGRAPDD